MYTILARRMYTHQRVATEAHDDCMHDHDLTHTAPGGMDRVRAQVRLTNAHPVPPGHHHDVPDPLPVAVTLRWETGDEQLDTIALEWWRPAFKSEGDGLNRPLVRVRLIDPRVMTGAVWVPAEDVRRR